MRLPILSTLLFVVSCVSSAGAQVCDVEIAPSDAAADITRFGWVVALSGDVAVVGAKEAGVGGAVYVYRFDGSSWIEEQILVASDAVAGDDFGISVAIDGDLIAVGARLPFGPGACYVFRYDGAAWVEESKIVPPVVQDAGWFGRSVALSGEQLVVGASGVDQGAVTQAGAAYLYSFSAGQWVLSESFVSSLPAPFADFGWSVDIQAGTGTIVIGEASGDTPSTLSCGSVHVFDPSVNGYALTERLVASDETQGGGLGASVSISGDFLLAGAPGDDELGLGMGSGASYVFARVGGIWEESQKLLVSGVNMTAGRSVSLAGDVAVIGTNGSFPPRVATFERQGATWVEDQVLLRGFEDQQFGYEVHIDGSRLIVGSPETSPALDRKTARIYTRTAGSFGQFVITEQPRSIGACPGETVELSVEVDAAGPATYQWQKNGVDLAGEVSDTLTFDPLTEADLAEYVVVVTSPCGTLISNSAEIICVPYRRGDSNGDGLVEPIGDAIYILGGVLPGGGLQIFCLAAANANGDHQVNIADAIFLLQYGFLGGAAPPAPFPDCGPEPDVTNGLSCNSNPCF